MKLFKTVLKIIGLLIAIVIILGGAFTPEPHKQYFILAMPYVFMLLIYILMVVIKRNGEL